MDNICGLADCVDSNTIEIENKSIWSDFHISPLVPDLKKFKLKDHIFHSINRGAIPALGIGFNLIG